MREMWGIVPASLHDFDVLFYKVHVDQSMWAMCLKYNM